MNSLLETTKCVLVDWIADPEKITENDKAPIQNYKCRSKPVIVSNSVEDSKTIITPQKSKKNVTFSNEVVKWQDVMIKSRPRKCPSDFFPIEDRTRNEKNANEKPGVFGGDVTKWQDIFKKNPPKKNSTDRNSSSEGNRRRDCGDSVSNPKSLRSSKSHEGAKKVPSLAESILIKSFSRSRLPAREDPRESGDIRTRDPPATATRKKPRVTYPFLRPGPPGAREQRYSRQSDSRRSSADDLIGDSRKYPSSKHPKDREDDGTGSRSRFWIPSFIRGFLQVKTPVSAEEAADALSPTPPSEISVYMNKDYDDRHKADPGAGLSLLPPSITDAISKWLSTSKDSIQRRLSSWGSEESVDSLGDLDYTETCSRRSWSVDLGSNQNYVKSVINFKNTSQWVKLMKSNDIDVREVISQGVYQWMIPYDNNNFIKSQLYPFY